MSLKYVTASELAALLRDADRDRNRTVVLDVRDDDFNDLGHIRGAVNIQAWDLLSSGEAIDSFVQQHLRRATTDRLVVHCYLSMQRGPSVAGRVQERLAQLDSTELIEASDVFVLKKGFKAFFGAYKSEGDLVQLA